MASMESINGPPINELEHNLREKNVYRNVDIDPEKTHLNYSLSPESHGRTTGECMTYYDELTRNVYHRGNKTSTAIEWIVTAPSDLPEEKEKEFFQDTYTFLNAFHFQGDDSRCILAQVHCDESQIGRNHMHYIIVMPEVENKKYISFEEKLIKGLKQTQEHFEIKINKQQGEEIVRIIREYEKSRLKSRERYAIRDIGEVLGLKHDDARWVFTRIRRLESERYQKRLMSKSEFMTKDMMSAFHPQYDQWMKLLGYNCTVYKGGTGINYTVEQLKQMTKETGYRLVDQVEYEYLQKKVSNLEHELENTKREQNWSSSGWKEERTWGKE